MKHRIKWVGIVGAALLLSGCSLWSNPFKESAKESGQSGGVAFVEPQVKESTGLTRVWKESVAGAPSKHQQHPGQIAVTGDDIFVGTFQGRVVRLNRERGRVLWETAVGDRVTGGVAIDASRVYAGTKGGALLAFDRETGKEVWRSPLSAPVTSAPVTGSGKVLCVTLDSRTYALNGEDGKRLWMHSTPPVTLVVMGAAPPTLDGRTVYTGYASGDVFALSLDNGAPLWAENLSIAGGRSELDLLQGVAAGIVLSEEGDNPISGIKKLFAVNHQGRAVALLPRNGARVWERRLSAIRRPWLMGKQLFFAEMEGHVVALSAGDGMELWRTRVSDGLLTAPVATAGKVVVADNRGRLISLDSNTGRVLGMDKLGEAVLADPVLVDNSLFLWTNEGNVLRYDF
ncbi:MAG: outer membrane protein assembly factor BamB [Magnetococcus sp. XQGC-1]